MLRSSSSDDHLTLSSDRSGGRHDSVGMAIDPKLVAPVSQDGAEYLTCLQERESRREAKGCNNVGVTEEREGREQSSLRHLRS